MLKIKQKFHITFPRFRLWPHRLKLSRPTPENDELITAIDADSAVHDDNWQLSEHPDTKQLTEYWTEVEEDIKHDPEWQKISESDA